MPGAPNPDKGNFVGGISLQNAGCFIMRMDASVCITEHCYDPAFWPKLIFWLNEVVQFGGLQFSLFKLRKTIQRCEIVVRDGLGGNRDSFAVLDLSPVEEEHVAFVVVEEGISVRH